MITRLNKTTLLLSILWLLMILSSCGVRNGNESLYLYENALDTGIDTHSEFLTSFRKEAGEDMDVVYLGKPRYIDHSTRPGDEWVSSDSAVASVQDGVVTGHKEGVVTISLTRNGNEAGKWDFAVTTFNDGRRAELSNELSKEEIALLRGGEGGIPSPEYLREQINTIQDAISYLQASMFERSGSLPILATMNSNWLWYFPPDAVLTENKGLPPECGIALHYLLRNDFERSGFLISYGEYEWACPWFYEDGYFYALEPVVILDDIKMGKLNETYVPFKTDSKEDLLNWYLNNDSIKFDVFAVLLVDASDYDFQPPVYRSFIHDSTDSVRVHSVIGLEDRILDKTEVLYTNPGFDFEIKSIPSAEVPDSLPKVGPRKGDAY